MNRTLILICCLIEHLQIELCHILGIIGKHQKKNMLTIKLLFYGEVIYVKINNALIFLWQQQDLATGKK